MKLSKALCMAFTAVLVSTNSFAAWQNSLKPVGTPAAGVQLVQGGKPLGSIAVPAAATPQETKASADLQQWIREMTRANLDITSGTNSSTLISIQTDPALGDEGYSIAVKDGRILLSGGKTRGAINAVYALLEEDLGCRFYTNDSILLPRSDTLVIAPVERRYIPKLKLRDPFYFCAFDPVWSLRNRTNAPDAKVPQEHGGHIDYGGTIDTGGLFVHTAANLVPPSKYLKDHPEYFGTRPDGTTNSLVLCATHPDVAEIATSHVLEVLRKNPNIEIVSVSKNDVTDVCHCERCKKLRADEGSDMANQLVLVNRVAEALEKDHPDLVVDTLAYLETINVPKTMRPHKNVAIRLCNDSVGAWTYPFTPAEQCPIAQLVRAWSAVHNRIHIWDYNVNFSHYLAPMPNLDIMAANIRFWVANKAETVMLQGGYQSAAERDELKCWVTGKLLWDPSRDLNALTQDFIDGHYGKAAPALKAYEDLLANMRTAHAEDMKKPANGIRYPMDAPFITKNFVTSATQLFQQARTLSAGDEQLIRRIERAELPILYVKCVRGPEFVGADYGRVVAEFERIARREKVYYIQEGGKDFEEKLAAFKKRIPAATPAAASGG